MTAASLSAIVPADEEAETSHRSAVDTHRAQSINSRSQAISRFISGDSDQHRTCTDNAQIKLQCFCIFCHMIGVESRSLADCTVEWLDFEKCDSSTICITVAFIPYWHIVNESESKLLLSVTVIGSPTEGLYVDLVIDWKWKFYRIIS